MSTEQKLHELAASIKAGLARHGVHVLDGGEILPALNYANLETEFEKRLCIENFARIYGFHVHWSTFLQVAIFRKPDQGGSNPQPA